MIRGAFNEKTKNIISPYYAKKEDQEFYKCSDPHTKHSLFVKYYGLRVLN